jgi:hypothetical protein
LSALAAAFIAVSGERAARADDHLGSAYVEPLGFLLFGPTLGVELGTSHLTGTVYGRWFDGGFLSRQLFLSNGDGFDFSYGVGVRGRYYLFGGMSGPHVGVALEYLATRVENHVDLVATNSRYLVPAIEGGYRLALGHRFYVGGAADVGYAVLIESSVDNLPGGSLASLFQAKDESRFYASATIDFGVYF